MRGVCRIAVALRRGSCRCRRTILRPLRGTVLGDDALGKLLVGFARLQRLEREHHRPDHHEDQNGDESADDTLQRLVVGEREVRAGEPDQHRQQNDADQGQEGAALEEGEHYSALRWMISTRRFLARFSGSCGGVKRGSREPLPADSMREPSLTSRASSPATCRARARDSS